MMISQCSEKMNKQNYSILGKIFMMVEKSYLQDFYDCFKTPFYRNLITSYA